MGESLIPLHGSAPLAHLICTILNVIDFFLMGNKAELGKTANLCTPPIQKSDLFPFLAFIFLFF